MQKIQKSLYITTQSLQQIQNFKRNYLENYNDSEHAVKTKNAPFFMIFPNISFFHMIVTYWTGPLISISHFSGINVSTNTGTFTSKPSSSTGTNFYWIYRGIFVHYQPCPTRMHIYRQKFWSERQQDKKQIYITNQFVPFLTN